MSVVAYRCLDCGEEGDSREVPCPRCGWREGLTEHEWSRPMTRRPSLKPTTAMRMSAECPCGWVVENVWSLTFFTDQIRNHRKRCERAK